MKIIKVFSIIFLVLFVITLPLASFVSNVGSQVLSEDGLKGLVMESVLSNQALPQRIREIVWFQSWYSDAGIDPAQRMLITGIRNEQYADLLDIVLPTDTRESLLENVIGGLFDWLDNDEVYPDVVIELAPIFNNIEENTPAVAAWMVNTLKVPPCSEDKLNTLVAGENADNLMALISCKPTAEYQETAVNQISPLIASTLSQASLPERVDLSAQLQSNLDEESALAAKGRLNRVSKLALMFWVIPILVLGIALALVVRSVDNLITWARWPLFVSGLIGTILAMIISNPQPILEARLMPPPASLPAPAAPILMAVLGNLLTKVSSALVWQMAIVLVIGIGLLGYSYRDVIISHLSKFLTWPKKWFEIKELQAVESE